MTDKHDRSTNDAGDATENHKPSKISYPDIHCPICNYCLAGLTEPVCPECGETFSPGWLYSSDLRFGWRWTRRRTALVVLASLIVLVPTVWIYIELPYWARGCLAFGCGGIVLPALGLYAMNHFNDK